MWVAEAYSSLSALSKHEFNCFRKRNQCYYNDCKLKKEIWTVPFERQHNGFLSYSIASCQTGWTTSLLLQYEIKRWRTHLSSSPNSKSKQRRNQRLLFFGCFVCIYHVAFQLHNRLLEMDVLLPNIFTKCSWWGYWARTVNNKKKKEEQIISQPRES